MFEQNKAPKRQQVVHQGSLKGSPAHKAGMKYGDVIVSCNGVTTNTIADYLEAIKLNDGTQRMEILRDNQFLNVVLDMSESKKDSDEIPDYAAMVEELEETRKAR